MNKTISILGTDYIVIKKKYDEEPYFKENGIDGYCSAYGKEIVYCDICTYPGMDCYNDDEITKIEQEVLRHEIVHAFLNESGLQDSSNTFGSSWAKNEEMIDWIAIQFPKILKVYEQLEII